MVVPPEIAPQHNLSNKADAVESLSSHTSFKALSWLELPGLYAQLAFKIFSLLKGDAWAIPKRAAACGAGQRARRVHPH